MSLELIVSETRTAISNAAADGTVDAGEVIQIAVALSQKLQALTNLSGSEKKTLLLSTIKKGLEEVMTGSNKDFIEPLLSATSVSIDMVLSAASGKLDLRKPSSWIQCLPICLGLAKSPLTATP